MRWRFVRVIVGVATVIGLGVSAAAPASAATGKLWYQMGTSSMGMGSWNNPQGQNSFAQAADDFVVGVGWKITEIQVSGFTDSDPGYTPVPPDSAEVYIYRDGGKVPGSLSYELDVIPVTILRTSLTMHTPTISLTKGTYWLSVVPNLTDPHSRWYWSLNTSPTPQGYLPVWRGFPDICVGLGQDWSHVSPTCIDYPNAGLMFVITGQGS